MQACLDREIWAGVIDSARMNVRQPRLLSLLSVKVREFHPNGKLFDIYRLGEIGTISSAHEAGLSKIVIARRGDGRCPLTAS